MSREGAVCLMAECLEDALKIIESQERLKRMHGRLVAAAAMAAEMFRSRWGEP